MALKLLATVKNTVCNGIRHNQTWIDEILHHLGLSDKADSNMRTGGMKRRVMVAQALVHRPPVIILDEPTTGVDVQLRQTLWRFIQSLNQQGHTIVLTTHYLEEAETLCDQIAILKQGRLLSLDNKVELMQRGQQRRVFLRLVPDQLPTALLGSLLQKRDQGYELSLTSPDDLEEILAVLHRERIKIHDIEVRRPDLEHIFVQLLDESQGHG